MLKRAAAVGTATVVSRHALAQRTAPDDQAYTNLTRTEARTLEAIVARFIPSDENGPGALEAGAARYIDRALGGTLAASRDAYAAGLAAVEAYARTTAGRPFAELGADEQDAVLGDVEENAAPGFTPDSATFFDLVLQHTLEGTFCDPYYGGNRDFIGWELLGYPGIRLAVGADEQRMDARLAMNRISAHDLPMFDADDADSGDAGDR